MVMLLMCLQLVDKEFGQPKNEQSTTREMFDGMLQQIRELERSVETLGRETEARIASVDAIAFLSESAMRDRMTVLEAEIALLQNDIARNENDIEKNDDEQQRIRELLAAVEQFDRDIEKAEQKIARFELEQLRLTESTFFVSNRHTSKLQPWLVVCNQNDVAVISLESGETRTYTQRSFSDWAKARPYDREYFVFYVRPSAVAYYEQLLDAVRRNRFKTGLDLIDETTDIRVVDKDNQLL